MKLGEQLTTNDMQRGRMATGGGVHGNNFKWQRGGGMTPQQRQDWLRANVAYRVKEALYYYIHKKFYMGGDL